MQRLQLRFQTTKGKVHAPARRAVLGWLRDRACGAYTVREIGRALLAQGVLTPERGQGWLSTCLSNLRAKGHVINYRDGGATRWQAAVPHGPHAGQAPAAPAATPPGVATPRRINVLTAPPLAGGGWAPAREGALDYMACPSLINGQRVPYYLHKQNP